MILCYPAKKIIKRLSLIAVAALLVVGTVFFISSRRGKNEKETFADGGTSFAVTVNLDGEERDEDKRLLFASLKGCNISAAIFCDCNYISAHADELSAAVKDGHSICILLRPGEGMNKYELMRYIAAENDRFFSLTGKYPLYARTVGKISGDVEEILNTYGQILCNDTVKCDESGCGDGGIIELENVTSASVCALTKEITERIAAGMQCISLGERKK